MDCSKKFWTENINCLFSSIQLVPHPNMPLQEQLNSITRLILIISTIMWLLNFKHTDYFLIISLAFIIIIYYIQRNKMQENYVNNPRLSYINYKPSSIIQKSTSFSPSGKKYDNVIINSGEILPFCNDQMSLENLGGDPENTIAIGMNQRLARGNLNNVEQGNPTTRIAPVVVPPSYDLDSWKDNNLIVFSAINSPGAQQEMYLSGYAQSTCCDYIPNGTQIVPSCKPKTTKENYTSIVAPRPGVEKTYLPEVTSNQRNIRENYSGIVAPRPGVEKTYLPEVTSNQRNIRENYSSGCIVAPRPAVEKIYLPTVENYEEDLVIEPNASGMVNTACGYNPQQTKVGLPSNYPAGNCEQDPSMTQYNTNLFTQTITPGNYTLNQVNEPINSNIGISFTQQFEPVTAKRDEKGLHYLLHDPRIIEPDVETPASNVKTNPDYDNVYDPRFYGYGTSYRSYLEPVTGQTRFMYDDVNAIKMPNYITRSKVDFLPYTDTYGPVQPGSEFGNAHNAEMRYLVQDSWLRNSVQFRDDMTERRMRKINSEAWQKRMYPNSSRPVGSGICRR